MLKEYNLVLDQTEVKFMN